MRETTHYIYSYTTRCGTISIIPENRGFKVMIAHENMGHYASAQSALDDIVGDHLGSTPFDVDLDQLGIPDDLADWQRKVFAVVKGLRPT